MMQPKLGIIAGKGSLPREIVAECQRSGRPYYVIALKGHAQAATVSDSPHAWVRLGAAGKMISILREQNVSQLVMAGSVNRPSLFELRPDFWTLKFFARTGVANKGDDGLLAALVKALEVREGFHVVGPHSLLPNILACEGCLSDLEPSPEARHDISIAWEAALDLGRRDIGQAAVARHGAVLALENASGTAAMISKLVSTSDDDASGVLVKVSKPGQELRADMPSIGPDTIAQISEAGLAGIALEAGKSIILNKSETIKAANRAGVFLIVMTDVDMQS